MEQDALEARIARLEQHLEGLQTALRQLAAWEGCALDIPELPESSREQRVVSGAALAQVEIAPTASRNGASELERS
jgi:hypothetical protein